MAGIQSNTQDKAEALEALLNGALAPTVNTPTVVSGTAQQDLTGLPSSVYVAIGGASGGTVAVAIGPTNAVAMAIMPAVDASLARNAHFRLPAGWFFKVTVAGGASITSATQVAGG